MKQWQAKLLSVGQNTDVELELNELGKAGWHFMSALGTPFGVKFLLQRQLDEEVDGQAFTDELARKFGVS